MESKQKSIEEKNREIAIAYAKYLKEHNLQPGDATFLEPDSLGEEIEKSVDVELQKEKPIVEPQVEIIQSIVVEKTVQETTAEKKKARAKRKKEEKIRKKQTKVAREIKPKEGTIATIENIAAAPLFFLDKLFEKIEKSGSKVGKSFKERLDKIVSTYRASKKTIGRAVLAVCLLCGVMLVVFNKFTVYEYAYNGKVLGYVDSQDDVTNVLQVASEQLSEVNEDNNQDIEFEANDNISFKLVRAVGQDTDDVDTTLNKLAYMTDIEVEAYGIYDGATLVTIVKDKGAAESTLARAKTTLGTPDQGMELVSVDFEQAVEIRPINVLLTSVQSNTLAIKQMTNGGKAKFYHLVEEDEKLSDIAADFGVSSSDIYDEQNKAAVKSVSAGDKVCIRKTINPLSVRMVETGRMKEVVPFDTVEKKSKDYYIGDKVVSVEGKDGLQIFDGTLTKVGGKVTNREVNSLEVIKEKVDEVILVGTAERPKTAPTGTFHNPMLVGSYVVTSRPGWRWGRTHQGVDMAAPVGTDVFASDGGTIIRAGWFAGYGNCIEIEHANGWMTRYGHLSYIGVKLGQKVYQGQYIGDVGNTGHSTGPHLHFETRLNGGFVNPDTKVPGGL